METGLTKKEILQQLEEHGHNVLPKAKPKSLIALFLHQFKSPLIYVLLAASIVSLALKEVGDAAFIFAVLVLNAIIGTIQEYSAQNSAAALQNMVPQFANVIRDGKNVSINTEDIVPGDIVILESGDKVPADIMLKTSNNLLIDESSLTGESLAIMKDSNAKSKDGDTLDEQINMAFAGTIVTRGRGKGEVVATALKTQIGQIAEQVTKNILIKPPLLIRIEKFTLKLMYAVLILVLMLFVMAFLKGEDMAKMFMLAVALAVSAIPEGLPVAITVALSNGMRRMSSKNVIVRKLVAVESLGSCTFIASDKTGTLTVNELTARHIILPDNNKFNITGEGITPRGDITSADSSESDLSILDNIIQTSILTNEGMLSFKDHEWVPKGDMVDVALLVMAKKFGLQKNELTESYPEILNVPYESERCYSASINLYNDKNIASVKGSPERILQMCSRMQTSNGKVPIDIKKIESQIKDLAQSGYRVLAFARGDVGDDINNKNPEKHLKELTFLGLVAMIDPLRTEVKDAVDICKKAGVEVAMITGDHPLTAKAIAIDLGLGDKDVKVLTGKDIAKALKKGEKALEELVADCRVYARIEPNQKKEIVEAITRRGHFVAVTGDGVNDAPALKHAHVGVAMGKRGTDVARESSDLILTDDNFSSIVQGIHEGRIVYSNIRKVIFLLVSTGAAEILMFILSLLFGLPMPLVAVQLLWLNLVTNGIQDIALAFEPAEGDELKSKPRDPKEPIFDRHMIKRVLVSALFMGLIAFTVFYWLIENGYSVIAAQNYVLMLMVLLENVQALNSRSEKRSIFKQRFFSNPLLIWSIIIAQSLHISCMYVPVISDILHLQPISFKEWSSLMIIACLLLCVDFITIKEKKK